ncbi:MAG TPA: tetratricopeptide repeat protein [Myxococcaceae bacterium]|nr:tetratricopeptide repeat protein [Myxococcaceae bacterium]
MRPASRWASAAALALAAGCTCAPSRPPSDEALAEVRRRALYGKQAGAMETLERWAKAGDRGARRALGDVCAADADRSVQERAARWYRLAAEAGDAAAQRKLGRALRSGALGLAVDLQGARRWFAAAAGQGDAGAELSLGLMARNGEGAPRDAEAGARWLERAAGHGSAEAMFHLGNAFANGEGVPRDLQRAREWYEKAAERDWPAALQTLGMAYLGGDLGLPRDPVKADELLREAAHPHAQDDELSP